MFDTDIACERKDLFRL